jgi:opacity protein-like surface antigen
MKIRHSIMAVAGTFLLASSFFLSAATAQDINPALEETITLRFGPFAANFDATVKAYGQDVKVDESLDASDVDFAVNGIWRITDRWRVEAAYSGIEKSSSAGTANDLTLGSVTIPAGLGLSSSFETQVVRVAAGYAFMRNDTMEIGLDLGINYTTVKQSLAVKIPDTPAIKDKIIDVSEPLPTIGLFFNYAFSSKWYLTTHAGAFAFDIGDIDGSVFDLFAGVEYRIWKNAGLGAAYIYNAADLTITDGGVKSDVEYDYNGPLLYLVVGF